MSSSSHELIDWRDFESFVSDLYSTYGDLEVEHDVTLVGKSGARRQIDVTFTHNAGGHTYLTLVECKFWKHKVSRDRIDVLYAGMEDLNAAKGVMFTTIGFEPGAEAYAQSKGIDLFLVRDLTDEEWGRPGRVVSFWMHYYGGQISNIKINDGGLQWMSVGPAPSGLRLSLQVGPNTTPDPSGRLYSVVDGAAGPHLIELILEARDRVMKTVASEHKGLLDDGAEDAKRGYLVPVLLDLSAAPHRELRQGASFGRLDTVSFHLLVTISQTRFRFDRGRFAVAVENFVTEQKRVATRNRETAEMTVYEMDTAPPEDAQAADPDVMTPDTLLQIYLEAWVQTHALTEPPKTTPKVTFALPGWAMTVERPPAEEPSVEE